MVNEQLKRRRNFLPTIVLLVALTIAWLIIFFFMPPEQIFAQPVFVSITLSVVFLSSSLLLASVRRGILTMITVAVIMILNYAGLGNWLNLILLVGIILTVDYYLSG